MITVTYICGTAQLTGATIPDVIYYIGTGPKTVTFEAFVDSVGSCGPISYTASAGNKALPGYLKFDTTGTIFTIESSADRLDGEVMSISVTGTLATNKVTASSSFTLSLVKVSKEDAASLEEFDSSFAGTSFSGVSAGGQGPKKKKAQPKPTLNATITSIDFKQRVTIEFSQVMTIPPNLTLLVRTKSLSFTVI
jgi:hypothetical protein